MTDYKIDGIKYVFTKFKKRQINRFSRPIRIAFFIDRTINRFNKLARCLLGNNRWRY